MSKLIRISDSMHAELESLSQLTGESKQKLLSRAITLFSYEQILKKANEQCAQLQEDPVAWAEMQAENDEWDATLADGLNHDD